MNISVVMPSFNSSRSIKKAVDSILMSNHVCQLIVADGGSTDDTTEILDTLSINDARLQVIIQEDDGLYDAVNKISPLIKGDYVQFINSDDYLEAEYHNQIDATIKSKIDYFYCDVKKDNEILGQRNENFLNRFQAMIIPHASIVVRVEVFKSLMPFDLNFPVCSDLDFVNRLRSSGAIGKKLNVVGLSVDPGGVSDAQNHLDEALAVAIKNKKIKVLAYVFRACQWLKYAK